MLEYLWAILALIGWCVFQFVERSHIIKKRMLVSQTSVPTAKRKLVMMNGKVLAWCCLMSFAWHVHGVNAYVNGEKMTCSDAATYLVSEQNLNSATSYGTDDDCKAACEANTEC